MPKLLFEQPSRVPSDASFPKSVADHIARLNVLLKRSLGSFAKENFDLNVVETRLLILLGIFGPATVSELAGRSDIDRTQISRTFGRLQKRRLIKKTSGGVDKREVSIAVTHAGQRVHVRIVEFLYAHNVQLLEGLPADAVDNFFNVIRIMIARAQELPT